MKRELRAARENMDDRGFGEMEGIKSSTSSSSAEDDMEGESEGGRCEREDGVVVDGRGSGDGDGGMMTGRYCGWSR